MRRSRGRSHQRSAPSSPLRRSAAFTIATTAARHRPAADYERSVRPDGIDTYGFPRTTGMSGELSQGERAVTNAPHHNPVDRRRFETPVSIRRVNGVLGRDRYRYLRLSPLTRHLADRRSP